MNRGQFSVEFVVVLGVLLTVLATVSIPLYNSSRDKAVKINDVIKAREAANELAQALNSCYAGSLDTKQEATYWLPGTVNGIESVALDNEFCVKITLGEFNENVLVDTLLPADWQNVVPLENIKIEEDNRTLHETTFIVRKSKKFSEDENIISVLDNILERE